MKLGESTVDGVLFGRYTPVETYPIGSIGYAELVDNYSCSNDAADDAAAGGVCLQLGNHVHLDSFFESDLNKPTSRRFWAFFIDLSFMENQMNSHTYITTAIPYVNGRPHIGFALELVQADAIARYHRLTGKDVTLQTGTDENAFKNVLTARELSITPEELVRRNAGLFLELAQGLGISFDSFVRTSDASHQRGAAQLWQALKPGDVYAHNYTGLYCSGCEDFYLEKDLVDGCCADHGRPPVEVQETNYFFRLSAYQDRLEQLINDDIVKVVPATRKNEVLSFIRSGLRDFSISRAARRSGGWGVPVPGDSSQVIYVWIDALANYLSGLGYGTTDAWAKTWNETSRKVHVIGKNVWKFHAVYWPALLLSAGLALPDEIVVHGFLTENGQKISKSCGASVDPLELIDTFGADPVRYYLLAEVCPFGDGDFSADRLRKTYETKLANTLGNLVSRLTTLCEKAGYCWKVTGGLADAPDGYHEALEHYELDKAVGVLWQAIADINQSIDRLKPWELLKGADSSAIDGLLSGWLGKLQTIAYWSAPFIPDTSQRIRQILSQQPICASGALFPK